MRIRTEIYKGADDNYWKITRKGTEVIIEQAIEPAEIIREEYHDDQQDDHSEVYEFYDKMGKTKKTPKIGTTLNRKV